MIYIDIQDKWEVCIFTQWDDVYFLIQSLKKLNCAYKTIRSAIKITESYDSGFTFSNLRLKASVVYISPTSSKPEWFDTLVHELKHVQSHICEYYDIDESGEEAAYLIGYLMKNVMQII